MVHVIYSGAILLMFVVVEAHSQSSDVDCRQITYRYYDDGKKFLSVSGRFEIVDDDDSLVIYRQPGIYKTAKHMFYYFSQTTSSPIYPLKKKYLKKFIHDDEVRDRASRISD